jgi:integrase
MGTVRFELAPEEKKDSKGRRMIVMIYQVSGKKGRFTTKEKVCPINWDQETQRAIYAPAKAFKDFPEMKSFTPSSNDIRAINSTLDMLLRKVADIENRFKLDGKEISVVDVLGVSTGRGRKDTPGLLREMLGRGNKSVNKLDSVSAYIDKYLIDYGPTRVEGSLSVYRSLKNHLEAFEADENIRVLFSSIDTSVFNAFQNYLVSKATVRGSGEAGLSNITAAKQLSTLKTFLKYAKNDGLAVSEKYKEFKIKKEKLEVISLTNDEFETLYHYDLSGNARLARVRDLFCFSCVTGLRYSDLSQLKWEHIKEDEIRITIKKTKTHHTIPLIPQSMEILERYKGLYKPIPQISNPKFNKYIKELCKLAGINDVIEIVRHKGKNRISTLYPKHELISAHTGRKTFCTLSLEKGMTAEEVMRISGHESYASFSRYVNITEQRKRESMGKAWGSVANNVSKLKVV